MAERLLVKPIKTGNRRSKLVVFPGHTFRPEHFLQENIYENFAVTHTRKFRAVEVESKLTPGASFISRVHNFGRYTVGYAVEPLSEARLARFVNRLGIEGVAVEEPLAAILNPNGQHQVFYRRIKGRKGITPANEATLEQFASRLKEIGIVPNDFLQNAMRGDDGRIHLFDLEFWRYRPEVARKLSLSRSGTRSLAPIKHMLRFTPEHYK